MSLDDPVLLRLRFQAATWQVLFVEGLSPISQPLAKDYQRGSIL